MELIALCTLLCRQMVFSSTECVVWRKMLGYVWDTGRSMFMLFLTCKNACDLDSVGWRTVYIRGNISMPFPFVAFH